MGSQVLENGHVVWAALNKDVRQIDRRRVRWVVVRREQVHGHVKSRHRVEGTREDLPVELVGLEHVASDHHKRATLAFSEAGDPADNVELALRVPRLLLDGEELSGHAQLPVCSV